MKKTALILLIASLSLIAIAKSQYDKPTLQKQGNELSSLQNKQIKQQPKIKILYFHGKQRCVSCRTIEKYTEELVKANYKQQLQNGTLTFQNIDFSTKEGEKIADKYEISFSSLLLIKTNNGKEEIKNLTDFAFSTAKNNEKKFKDGVSKEIQKLLK